MSSLLTTSSRRWSGSANGKITDVGRYAVTHNETDRGKFEAPSLRLLALTAPYMHDGSLKDLRQVLDFYIGGGNSHPNSTRKFILWIF